MIFWVRNGIYGVPPPPQRFVTNYDNGLSLTEDSLFAKTGKWMQLLLAYNLKYVLNSEYTPVVAAWPGVA